MTWDRTSERVHEWCQSILALSVLVVTLSFSLCVCTCVCGGGGGDYSGYNYSDSSTHTHHMTVQVCSHDMHDSPPATESISIHCIQQGLRDSLKQIVRFLGKRVAQVRSKDKLACSALYKTTTIIVTATHYKLHTTGN